MNLSQMYHHWRELIKEWHSAHLLLSFLICHFIPFQIDSAFSPTVTYGESLVVLSAIPVIWLLLTLLLFLIFFCVRCCQACLKSREQEDDTTHLADKEGRVAESRTASCCLNLWLILFLFLLVVAVGAGYFANEETDNGVKVWVLSNSVLWLTLVMFTIPA